MTIVELGNGGFLSLSFASGNELSRQVPEGITELGPLFTAIVESASASSSTGATGE